MTIGYLTRAVHFSASHSYHRPDWSEEENRRRFGEAAAPEGHGHNYRCEVTVCGPIDAEAGMVMELPELDRLLDAEIVRRFGAPPRGQGPSRARAGGSGSLVGRLRV
jgi:6-pyruvoyl-tetrahydropterin synthase